MFHKEKKTLLGGACGEVILTSLNIMDAVIPLQPYRLGVVLISDGVCRAVPAISAATGARGDAVDMVGESDVELRAWADFG